MKLIVSNPKFSVIKNKHVEIFSIESILTAAYHRINSVVFYGLFAITHLLDSLFNRLKKYLATNANRFGLAAVYQTAGLIYPEMG